MSTLGLDRGMGIAHHFAVTVDKTWEPGSNPPREEIEAAVAKAREKLLAIALKEGLIGEQYNQTSVIWEIPSWEAAAAGF